MHKYTVTIAAPARLQYKIEIAATSISSALQKANNYIALTTVPYNVRSIKRLPRC